MFSRHYYTIFKALLGNSIISCMKIIYIYIKIFFKKSIEIMSSFC